MTKRTFKVAFRDSLPILAGYIAMSIADRPGLAVGFVGGALASAGYSLSKSILFDCIIRYCIQNQQYDIFAINDMLLFYDQNLLGQN